ncbi:F0F1 ATP synthase subunit delta [Candidatus Uhrbacteria bacterium]|nr:F0F1 ATP synthase subunit delta [Candidatus Uhrbacteria bacterium]
MNRSEKPFAVALVAALADADEKTVQAAAEDLVRELSVRRELHRMRGIIDALDSAWSARYGAGTITIATAYPLSGALRKKIEKIAQGAEVREVVDPDVIGGARMRVDEKIIEGTIQGSLEQLARAFQNV